MRDKERIHRILGKFEAVWLHNPDWRLGQLVSNLKGVGPQDVFYLEDNELETLLEAKIEQYKQQAHHDAWVSGEETHEGEEREWSDWPIAEIGTSAWIAAKDEGEVVDFIDWCLGGSYTREGVRKWWRRPRVQLENRSPNDAFAAGDVESVVEIARRVTDTGYVTAWADFQEHQKWIRTHSPWSERQEAWRTRGLKLQKKAILTSVREAINKALDGLEE